jgi:putative ABC transport system permease protein
MLKATLKGLLARKLRLALAGLAVVLGVMAVSAAMIATTTIGTGFTTLFQTVNSTVDVSVSGRPEVGSTEFSGKAFTPPVPESLVARLKEVPGAASVTGEVSVDGARPVGPDGKVISLQGPPRTGLAWHGETGMVRLREGRGPTSPTEVAINGGLAELGGFKVGQSIDVLTLQARRTFTIVGVYGFSNGLSTLGGDTQVAFVEPLAQELMLGETGVYSSITVATKPGVSRTELRDQVSAVLGQDYLVRTGEEVAGATAANGGQFLDIVRLVLLGFSGLCLLIGIFLILNTFSILIAQRTSELALLAALGARRRQIIGSVMIEALLVGTAASIVGLGLGIGVAALLKSVMQSQSGAQLPVGLIVPPWALALGFAVGVGVTLLAAVVPALRASRVSPVQAMRSAAAEQRSLGTITAVGSVLTVGGIGAVLASVVIGTGGLRWWLLGGGIVVGLAGLTSLTPLASRVILPSLGKLLSWSMPGKLGRRNAARNPRRTAITVSTLMITLSLVGGVSVVAESLRADLTSEVAGDLGADLVIAGDGIGGLAGAQGGAPEGANGRITATFDPGVIDKVRRIPGVSRAADQYVDTVQLAGVDGRPAVTAPAAGADLAQLSAVLGLQAAGGQLRDLHAGEIALDEATLSERGLKVGDTARLATQRGGWQDYRIVAGYRSSYLLRGPVLPVEQAKAQFVSAAPALGYVDLTPGADSFTVRTAVSGLLTTNPEVSVRDQTQVAKDAAGQVDTAEAMLYLLLGLSVIIGILGIVNTMALSILERTRELGLLRAIGMRRGNMVHMVVSESLVMAVFGGLLGLLAGTAAGVAFVEVAGLGQLALSWTSMGLFLALAVAAGLVAALIPSARAAKVNVLSAIAYE